MKDNLLEQLIDEQSVQAFWFGYVMALHQILLLQQCLGATLHRLVLIPRYFDRTPQA
jgi:hypothetical protein